MTVSVPGDIGLISFTVKVMHCMYFRGICVPFKRMLRMLLKTEYS